MFSVIIEIFNINKWKVRTSFEIILHIKDIGIPKGAVYLRLD